jgi:ribose 5-phosphate isomerase B
LFLKLLTMVYFTDIIAIGTDHAGYKMKEFLLENLKAEGFRLKDYGTFSEEPVDYPDVIHPLAKDINDGQYKRGIIICGSGNGVAITANKYINVRAAICWEKELVKLSRQHNDANIIVLPARFISLKESVKLVKLFCSTGFEGGRHQRRVEKISSKL